MIDEAQAELLRRLAHDLRSPLEVLRGTLGDLPSLENKTEREQATRLAGRALNRLLRLAERLDLTAALSEGLTSSPVEVDVRATVQAALNRLQSAEPRSSVTLDVRGEASWRTDPRMLAAAVTELASNALKFARARVTVAIDPASVVVEDDGPGLDQPDLEQVLRAAKPSHNGLGLGLPLTVSLARLLGVQLSVSPREPSGTFSRFELRR